MPEPLDPYHKWLGIPPSEQPPNAYRLLGLRLLESNPEVIQNAVDRQTLHLRTYQLGEHSDASQRLLNEVAAAQLILLDADKKTRYDAELLAKSRPISSTSFEPAPPGEPVLLGVPRPASPGPLRPVVRHRRRRLPGWVLPAAVVLVFFGSLFGVVGYALHSFFSNGETASTSVTTEPESTPLTPEPSRQPAPHVEPAKPSIVIESHRPH
ncbi:MAG: hypothetical protein JW888_15885 [Pirellulales bacterium]|nr:hypothetical protein [Pirellulales bacterium]